MEKKQLKAALKAAEEDILLKNYQTGITIKHCFVISTSLSTKNFFNLIKVLEKRGVKMVENDSELYSFTNFSRYKNSVVLEEDLKQLLCCVDIICDEHGFQSFSIFEPQIDSTFLIGERSCNVEPEMTERESLVTFFDIDIIYQSINEPFVNYLNISHSNIGHSWLYDTVSWKIIRLYESYREQKYFKYPLSIHYLFNSPKLF